MSSSSSSVVNSSVSSNSFQTNFLPNVASLVSIRLDDSNFLNWKQHMLNVIRSFGLLHHVSKEPVIPAENTPERLEWDKKDCYVQVLISSSLSPSLLHLTRNVSSASEMWNSIEESFFQSFFAKQTQYRTQFHLLKQEDKPVSKFLDEVKDLFDSLNAIGDKMGEETLIMQILQGLNKDFENFVINIEARDSKLTYNQLRAKILTHEVRVQQRMSAYSPQMTAMIAASGAPQQDGTRVNRNPATACQICGKTNHSAAMCYFRYTPVEPSSNGRGNSWRNGNGGRGRISGGRSGGRHRGSGGRNGGSNFSGFVASTLDTGFQNPTFGTRDGILGSGPSSYSFGASQVTRPNYSSAGPNFTNNFGPPTYPSTSPQFGPNLGIIGHPSYGPVGPNTSQTIGSGTSLGFGPDHFQAWVGSGSQTSTAPTHYGLHADLATTCERVESWIPDSGATAHMTSDASIVFGSVPYTGPEHVVVGDESSRGYTPPHAS